MKLVYNLELLSNLNNKVVCVYKIEQQELLRKNKDIRDIASDTLQLLFSEITAKKEEIFFFDEEILIDNLFKIFIFVVCDSDKFDLIEEILSKLKWVQFADKYEMTQNFLKKHISKIIKTQISLYFKSQCKLENMKDFYFLSRVNIFDYDYSNYLYFTLTLKDIHLVKFIQQENIVFIKIQFLIDGGLLKLKECENITTIKTLSKIEMNQIFNRNYLSQVKMREDKNSKIFLVDERTKLKTPIHKFKCKLILNFPTTTPYKSKFYYPYILVAINDSLNNFNNKYFQNYNGSFSSVALENIIIEQSDNIFFNQRISLINEEENLKIYEKIHTIMDKMKNTSITQKNFNSILISTYTKNLPIAFNLNFFLANYDKNLISNPLFTSYYLSLHRHRFLFVAGDEMSYPLTGNTTCKIKLYDEDFKNYFESAFLEFFAFILYFCKNKTEEEEEKNGKEENTKLHENFQEKLFDTSNDNMKEKFDIAIEDIKNINNTSLNNCSFHSNSSSHKKSLLKPFNKDEILYQDECETDYGNKKVTKKDLKNRQDYIKKVITNANKALIEKVEEDIIHGNVVEKQKKVVFCIPNDRNSIINKLPNL